MPTCNLGNKWPIKSNYGGLWCHTVVWQWFPWIFSSEKGSFLGKSVKKWIFVPIVPIFLVTQLWSKHRYVIGPCSYWTIFFSVFGNWTSNKLIHSFRDALYCWYPNSKKLIWHPKRPLFCCFLADPGTLACFVPIEMQLRGRFCNTVTQVIVDWLIFPKDK